MDEDEVVVRMSVQDVALLREVARWRRNHDVAYFQWRRAAKCFGVFTEWKQWREVGEDWVQFNVSYEPGGEYRYPRLVTTSDYKRQAVQELPVRTVTEAVDCLAALGFLPPRFSSAYRAGWEAATLWNSLDPNNPVQVLRHNALFHDPENVSFPAVEAAW